MFILRKVWEAAFSPSSSLSLCRDVRHASRNRNREAAQGEARGRRRLLGRRRRRHPPVQLLQQVEARHLAPIDGTGSAPHGDRGALPAQAHVPAGEEGHRRWPVQADDADRRGGVHPIRRNGGEDAPRGGEGAAPSLVVLVLLVVVLPGAVPPQQGQDLGAVGMAGTVVQRGQLQRTSPGPVLGRGRGGVGIEQGPNDVGRGLSPVARQVQRQIAAGVAGGGLGGSSSSCLLLLRGRGGGSFPLLRPPLRPWPRGASGTTSSPGPGRTSAIWSG